MFANSGFGLAEIASLAQIDNSNTGRQRFDGRKASLKNSIDEHETAGPHFFMSKRFETVSFNWQRRSNNRRRELRLCNRCDVCIFPVFIMHGRKSDSLKTRESFFARASQPRRLSPRELFRPRSKCGGVGVLFFYQLE